MGGELLLQSEVDIPWCNVLRSGPVWGMVVAHFSCNWGNYTLLTCLPKYLHDVLHFDIEGVSPTHVNLQLVHGIRCKPLRVYLEIAYPYIYRCSFTCVCLPDFITTVWSVIFVQTKMYMCFHRAFHIFLPSQFKAMCPLLSCKFIQIYVICSVQALHYNDIPAEITVHFQSYFNILHHGSCHDMAYVFWIGYIYSKCNM